MSNPHGWNTEVTKRVQKTQRGFAVVGVVLENICDPVAACAGQRSWDLIQGATESLQQGSVSGHTGVMVRRVDAFALLINGS